MKIEIITIHDPDVNYGSTLQSCGTFNFIKNLGYNVEIINYRPNYKSTLQRLKRKLINLLFYKDSLIRRKKINSYFSKYANLSKQYNSYDELFNDPPVAEVYITGSDVIWNKDVNPEGADSAYYLGFVKNGICMSYAPSMGEIQPAENILFIKKQISDFKFISVREELSKKQLINAGINNVYCTIDPVFLLDRSYYEEQVTENKYGEYTLVYLMTGNKTKRKKVNDITCEYGSIVIGFGGFKQKCDCNKYIRDAGVEDFLSLIYYAKHIVTDSFHCICFSLIFEKQFLYLPSIDSSMRIENILSYVNLENRIIMPHSSGEFPKNEINYEIVRPLLFEKILYSRKFLECSLAECKKECLCN